MIEKKDHKSLNHIQMHKLSHFLEKNIPWLNLVLVDLITKVEHSAKQSLKVEQTQKAKL